MSSTEATVGDAEVQGEATGVPDPVNCVVEPTQTLRVPVISHWASNLITARIIKIAVLIIFFITE
jgi:hypothetical protein